MKTISGLFIPELLALADREDRRAIVAGSLTSGHFGSKQLETDNVIAFGETALDARRELGATIDDSALDDVRAAIRRLPIDPALLRVARLVASRVGASSVFIGLSSTDAAGCILLISFRPNGSLDVFLPDDDSVIRWTSVLDRIDGADLIYLQRGANGRSDAFAWRDGVLAQHRPGGQWEEKGRGVQIVEYLDRAGALLGEPGTRG